MGLPALFECQHWIHRQQAANITRGWFIALIGLAVLGVIGGIVLLPDLKGLLAIMAGVILGGLAPFVYGSWQRKQKEADHVKPARHCVVSPVVYSEWSGSVHTFYFASLDFTERFRTANARKVIGW